MAIFKEGLAKFLEIEQSALTSKNEPAPVLDCTTE